MYTKKELQKLFDDLDNLVIDQDDVISEVLRMLDEVENDAANLRCWNADLKAENEKLRKALYFIAHYGPADTVDFSWHEEWRYVRRKAEEALGGVKP